MEPVRAPINAQRHDSTVYIYIYLLHNGAPIQTRLVGGPRGVLDAELIQVAGHPQRWDCLGGRQRHQLRRRVLVALRLAWEPVFGDGGRRHGGGGPHVLERHGGGAFIINPDGSHGHSEPARGGRDEGE